ncbi:MAG TPA: hypothetical protein PLF75_04030 [Bacteroidales bacterium]|nr:hypothetical protein [Bacteroidales bacterium]
MEEYAKVVEWAMSKSNHYLPGALEEFLNADEADAFLVLIVLQTQLTEL